MAPTPKTKPEPPAHLSESSAEFWRKTQADYAIADDHGLKLLTLACESLDAAETARAAVAKHGQTYIDRFDALRIRPEVTIQRNAMVTFARLTRELGLEPKDDKPAPKPVSFRDRSKQR